MQRSVGRYYIYSLFSRLNAIVFICTLIEVCLYSSLFCFFFPSKKLKANICRKYVYLSTMYGNVFKWM